MSIFGATPRRELVAWSVLGALLLIDMVTCVLTDAGSAVGDTLFAGTVNNAFYLLPGVLVAVRARRTRGPTRPAWLFLAAGMLAYAAGNLYWTLFVADLDPEPLVTPADPMWLAFYPCFATALVLLLRYRLPRVSAPAWFDGVIAAGAVSALVSLPVLHAVDPAPGSTMLGVVVNAAYPLSDIAVAGCLLGAWALSGWRADRVLILLIAGMGLFATADAISMVLLWQAVDVPASLGMMWTLGLTLLALAAHQPSKGVTARKPSMLVSTAIPSALAFLCLTLLSYAAFTTHEVAPVSSALAVTAVAAAIVRMMLSVRGAEALGTARRQARTDELTGLANRRCFVEHLDAKLAARGETELAVAFVDLDRFKEVNDSFGHDVGDSLLRMVGERLRESIEPPVMLARLGGDEFGLVMPGMGTTEAAAVVDQVLRTLREPFALREVDLHVDASIGIAICPADGDDRSTLLRRADVAMYTAKTGHGGPVFATGLDDQAKARLTMLEELRAGLGRDELVLHYQPKVTVEPVPRVHGVEALVRWQHPERGLIYPDTFLYTAESADLMGRITALVLELAIRQAREWHAEGLEISVAVNLSVSDLRDPGFPDQIAELLHRYALPTSALELEVTESVLMTDAEQALSVLGALRAMGIRLAVDDYGTGYSSLSYLQKLPVDDLKLDRAFVSRCATDERSAAIVQSTVQLAHSLGMRIVAEGVEDSEIFARLQEYGCDLAQGYGILRPQSAAVVTDWLRSQTSAMAA
ncbi:diguanylate cyclase (GGDEF)-like protein [Actinoplanes lutulentus]|uniref:Diguanylate cyclase/phosphodiesterase n=1 Tax=Actinoplanes lutulentus TaxID=1287878 RepID=A0A327YWN1_9ACTN|nr:EAL domain-containing protein [Actinoplanes lutulentus]MBB2940407.1 diguanylate cyclase (GGDEF)-like protein [Actinoplanes lutulentus]RAK25860.1 diguanylate cyclase/phosphodiesterase [Actinoplanes lutulentus]